MFYLKCKGKKRGYIEKYESDNEHKYKNNTKEKPLTEEEIKLLNKTLENEYR